MKRLTLAERIEAKTRRAPGGHLCWRGSVNSQGRPILWMRGRTLSPARLLWERKFGPIPWRRRLWRTCSCEACIAPEHHKLGRRPISPRGEIRQAGTDAENGATYVVTGINR